jgi:hypothetical protein
MEKFESKTLPVVLNHRGQEINLNEHILGIQIEGGAIVLKIKCNNMGTTASPFNIYAALMGVNFDPKKLDEASRRFLIKKIAMEW